ncbi:MAG TPA: hypothetical protein VFW75_04500 [Acetobacteraceae bacterium]|nr:hypothetical protein [Acetobacteraceae bacterium]
MSADSAAKSLETWSKALANAQRDLGKKGKLPKAHEDIKAYLTKGAALAKTLEDQMKQTEQTLKTYRNTLTDVEAACSDYSQLVSKSDFNLVIAHPIWATGSTGDRAASTKRRTWSTEARLAFVVLTTERKAA